VFIDNFSNLSFVWLQKTATAAETVEGKQAFEMYCSSHGVQEVQHCHADMAFSMRLSGRLLVLERGKGYPPLLG
jgi:hypothetical protein